MINIINTFFRNKIRGGTFFVIWKNNIKLRFTGNNYLLNQPSTNNKANIHIKLSVLIILSLVLELQA